MFAWEAGLTQKLVEQKPVERKLVERKLVEQRLVEQDLVVAQDLVERQLLGVVRRGWTPRVLHCVGVPVQTDNCLLIDVDEVAVYRVAFVDWLRDCDLVHVLP